MIKKNKIAFNSLSLLLVIILTFPLFTQLFHALKGSHEHIVCHNETTHLHQSKTDCNICDFNFTPFIYKQLPGITKKPNKEFHKKPLNLYHYLYFSNTINSKKHRGPPTYS